jgi:hypothetical protein
MGHEVTERGIEVLLEYFFNFGARYGWVVKTTRRACYPRETDPVPIVQEPWRPYIIPRHHCNVRGKE